MQRSDYGPTQDSWYLLRFHECFNCSLSGGGTLDGSAPSWVTAWDSPDARAKLLPFADPSCAKPVECRPRLLGITESRDVKAFDLRLQNPVYWTVHVYDSERVQLEGLRIRSDWRIANTDGIDVDGSRRVSIRGCRVDTADDAVCLKTTRPDKPLRDVWVSDCVLRSRSAAIKLGSESRADMTDVLVERVAVKNSHRGVGIQLRDGGRAVNVTFRDLRIVARQYHPAWWGGGEAVAVSALPRGGGDDGALLAGPGKEALGIPSGGLASDGSRSRLQNLTLERIVASSEGGIVLFGDAGSTLQGVSLRDFRSALVNRSAYEGGRLDLRPSARGLRRMDRVPALRIRHVLGLRTHNTTLQRSAPFRPEWVQAVEEEFSSDVDLTGLEWEDSWDVQVARL